MTRRTATTIREAVEHLDGIYCRLEAHTCIKPAQYSPEYIPAKYDYTTPEAGERASYSAVQPCAPDSDFATHFVPGYLSGSDYSGSSVERANFVVFMGAFGAHVVELSGEHGTYAVAVPLVWSQDACECGGDLECGACRGTGRAPSDFELKAAHMLAGLADYPCIDDEAVSEIEVQWAGEAWSTWAAREFRRALVALFSDEDESETVSERLSGIGDGKLREFFERAREAANEYWESEHAGVYIDVERVVCVLNKDMVWTFIAVAAL